MALIFIAAPLIKPSYQMSDRQLLSYPLPMMPDVDYQIFDDDVELIAFESHVMKNCMAFFEKLKETLAVHHVAQTPEYLIMHLGAYVGALMTTDMTLTQIKTLTPNIHALLKQHADLAYQKFMQYPVSVANEHKMKRSKQLDQLTKNT